MSVTLLPPTRTPFELAFDQANAARHPHDAQLVKALWNADDCPAQLLGYLAAALSVDLWDEAWPELKKRDVCRRAVHLHRIKTTLAGIKAHVAIAGGEVLRVVRPPARGFLGGAMTDAQRRAWLDSLPQVRIYPFLRRSVVTGRRRFYTGPGARKQFHGGRGPRVAELAIGAGGRPLAGIETAAIVTDAPSIATGFLLPTRGPQLLGRRATYFDHGQEIEIRLDSLEAGAIEQLRLPRLGNRRSFHGRGFAGRSFLQASRADDQVVTIQADDTRESYAIPHGPDPVSVRPERVHETRTAPIGRSFHGRGQVGRSFMSRSHAPYLVYDRVSLADPDRIGQRRKALSFHGVGRFGIEPFTAELTIRVPMRRHRRCLGRWHGTGFMKAADMTPLARVVEAVRVSKALRDTIRIGTTTHRRAAFGDGLRFGDFAFGQIREAV